MTFLEFSMLFGLTLVSAPVLIHLLNRAKARPVAWGAMRFLSASLTTRRRRLVLEEVALLALRCLLVAAAVTAMARPFLPSQPTFPWPIALLLLAVAAVCVGAAAAFWTLPGRRRRLIFVAAVAAAVAIAASWGERLFQKRSWLSGSGDRDVVLVVDGSESMRILVDGKSNFERARAEAVQIVESCGSGDAIGLIIAGAAPLALTREPTSDRKGIVNMLNHRGFQPIGGSFGALEALNAAAALLAEGRNPVRQIVVLTDRQNVGWDIQSQTRWTYLSRNLNVSAPPPKVIVRRLPFPQHFRNAAVAEISFPHGAPGVGQAVEIEVAVINGGDTPIQPAAVSLSINGKSVAKETFVRELPPGASETVRFEHRFDKPGRAVLSAELACDDDLAADNSGTRVLDIIDALPVLVIDGAPSKRPLEGSADFIAIALAPGQTDDAAKSLPPQNFPARPQVMTAAAASQADLDQYRVIVLANPPRIPLRLAEKLMRRVKAGGGLLIAPGDRADPQMLNALRSTSGERFLPAELLERRSSGDTPMRLALKTFTHPALRLCAETTRSDASLALIRSYWRLGVDTADVSVGVGGSIDNGDPFLVEQQVGRGRIAMTAFALDLNDSTLPSLRIFAPTIHELVYHLASGGTVEANIKPGTEMLFELGDSMSPAPVSTTTSSKAEASGRSVEVPVKTPSGKEVKATLTTVGKQRMVRCSDTRWPGLYTIQFGQSPESPKGLDGQPLAELPFVVKSSPEESSLKLLSDDELATLRPHADIFLPSSVEELLAATTGGSPGQELWKYLMATAMLLLVAETALTRWIAVGRRANVSDNIDFHAQSASERLKSSHNLTGGGGSLT